MEEDMAEPIKMVAIMNIIIAVAATMGMAAEGFINQSCVSLSVGSVKFRQA